MHEYCSMYIAISCICHICISVHEKKLERSNDGLLSPLGGRIVK